MISRRTRRFAGHLRTLISAAPMTQRDLAASIGRTHSALSAWQHGAGVPKPDQLHALLAAVGATRDDQLLAADLYPLERYERASGPGEWLAAAAYIADQTGIPGVQVADVLESLARFCAASDEMCGTSLTVFDLRAIAAVSPQFNATD